MAKPIIELFGKPQHPVELAVPRVRNVLVLRAGQEFVDAWQHATASVHSLLCCVFSLWEALLRSAANTSSQAHSELKDGSNKTISMVAVYLLLALAAVLWFLWRVRK